MSDLKIAIGFNNASGLASLNPQPSWTSIKYAKVTVAESGALSLQGPYLEMQFSDSITETNWFSILSACGLSIKNAILYKNCTIQIPSDEDSSTTNYNTTIRYLDDGSRNFRFWKSKLLAVNLIAI